MSAEHALAEVSFRDLRREIVRRGYDAEDLGLDLAGEILGDPLDTRALEEAAVRLRRGETAEALHWIERAAPYAFAGLAASVLPPRST